MSRFHCTTFMTSEISPGIPFALAWSLKHHAMLFSGTEWYVVQEGVRQKWPID